VYRKVVETFKDEPIYYIAFLLGDEKGITPLDRAV